MSKFNNCLQLRNLCPMFFLKLHDLRKYKLLGEGSFGKVYLTSIKGKNDPYALKIMHKKSLIEQDQVSSGSRRLRQY